MEGNINFGKLVTVPVALKGGSNYLLWSRLVKTAIGRLGLWSHITDDGPELAAKETEEGEEEKALAKTEAKKWVQEDLMVLSVLQGSLEVPLLEAYSYCETPKHLWETLSKTFGNVSNISRVFELKRVINSMKQDGGELTKHMGKFGSLWSELESLRPNTTDQAALMERREQDQVFGLLMTLDPCYKDVIKHILRSPNLPSMEEVCAQLQKEEGSLGLFGGKGELTMAHQAEGMQANKAAYRGSGRKYEKYEGSCEHCKRTGHKKSECWILHPHLRPRGSNRDREAKAHLSAEANGAGSSGASSGAKVGESEGRALASHQLIGKGMDQEVFKRADLEAFFKALKESGNTLGNTLGYSYAAHTLLVLLISY